MSDAAGKSGESNSLNDAAAVALSPNNATSVGPVLTQEDDRGPASVPRAIFFKDVSQLMDHHSEHEVQKRLQELKKKYEWMENELDREQRIERLSLPELEKDKECVEMLIRREAEGQEWTGTFKLSDNIMMDASIPPTKTVAIWIGADTMLEFPLEEARTTLTKKIERTKDAIEQLQSRLEFVREQRIISEVNISRVHNFCFARREVARKRLQELGYTDAQQQDTA